MLSLHWWVFIPGDAFGPTERFHTILFVPRMYKMDLFLCWLPGLPIYPLAFSSLLPFLENWQLWNEQIINALPYNALSFNQCRECEIWTAPPMAASNVVGQWQLGATDWRPGAQWLAVLVWEVDCSVIFNLLLILSHTTTNPLHSRLLQQYWQQSVDSWVWVWGLDKWFILCLFFGLPPR